jgi:hypothetical protein
MIQTVRLRQFDTRAVQWLGSNEAEVNELCPDFGALAGPCSDDPEATAQLLAAPHSTWVLVYDGDWVVAVPGGYVRMTDEEFVAAYEPVTS